MSLFQLTNWRSQINSTNHQLLYKPGKIGEAQLFGYVVDFQLFADLRSIPEVALPKSEPLASEAEMAEAFYELPKNNFFKKIGIYSSADDGATFERHFGCYLFNRRPYFYVDLLPNLTKAASLQIGKDGRTGEPISIWGRVEPDNNEENNTGGTTFNDSISVWISANEEAPRLTNVKSVTLVARLTNALQSYVLTIPEGLLSYSFKVRDNPGDVIAPIKFSWQPGLVDAGSGYSLDPSAEESESGVFLVGKKLYLMSDTPGVTVIFKGWV